MPYSVTKPFAAMAVLVLVERGVLDLDVPVGRCLAIIGPSGSGKSTLLGLIAGLDSATTGTITLKAMFENKDNALWPGQFVQVQTQIGVDRGAHDAWRMPMYVL